MDDALHQHLPESHKQPSFGGSCYWVRGPEGLDAAELQLKAMAQDILIEPGEIHFLGDEPPKNYFRLGYSSIPTDRIEPGIRKLAELIKEMT